MHLASFGGRGGEDPNWTVLFCFSFFLPSVALYECPEHETSPFLPALVQGLLALEHESPSCSLCLLL